MIRSHTHEVCSETIKKNLPFQKTTTSGSFKMIIFTRSLMDTSELTGETLRGCEFFFHRSDDEKFQWSFKIKVDFKMFKNCTLKSTLISS